jgi:DNA polymerase
MNKLEVYSAFNNEVKDCSKCDLGVCKKLDGYDPHVVGQGNVDADLMFIAEAPGKQETIHGRPLTPPGTSGNVYENILKFMDLTRDDVYTTNVVLCRPPNNRDPELYEVKKCQPYLERQIKLVEPKLIVTFGRFAAQAFVNNFKITKDHGNIIRSEKYGINIFPVYHPAYYKAYASAKRRAEFKTDINKLKKIVSKKFRKVA